MSKINVSNYVEIVNVVDAEDEYFDEISDKDYKKFEKIRNRKHHFKEGRNLDRIRDRQKNHRQK